MRKIKFRAKRIDNDEWVYGYYVKDYFNEKCFIAKVGDPVVSHIDLVEVVPETIGQFTGITDKNGIEIYEGDNIRVGYSDMLGEPKNIFITMKNPFDLEFEEVNFLDHCNEFEIIGNIHDQLLERGIK